MYQALLALYLLVAIVLIALVLVQQGKGADMGASFGAGGSNTLFGSSGSGNFLTKSTTAAALIFFVLSLVLGNLSSHHQSAAEDFTDLSEKAQVEEQAPAIVEPEQQPAQPEPGDADVPE